MVSHTLLDSPELARSTNAAELSSSLVGGFISVYDDNDDNSPARKLAQNLYELNSGENPQELDRLLDQAVEMQSLNAAGHKTFLNIWQKIPLLIQRANDQSLRNRVYDGQKENGAVTYSIEGAFAKLDLDNGNLEEIMDAMRALAIITLTRHPTTVFPDEIYQHTADVGESLHNLAKNTAKNEDNFESLANLLDALVQLKRAPTDFVHGKKDPFVDEGYEEASQLENIYKGTGIIVDKILALIGNVKDDTRRDVLMTFARDELMPVMMAVWGSGPDMDNNLNAKAKNSEDFHELTVARLKTLYKQDLFLIMRLLPDNDPNKHKLRDQALKLVAANGAEGESDKIKLANVCETLAEIEKDYPDNKLLRQRVIGFMVKSRCFQMHFAYLDFRQDTEITSQLSEEIFGKPAGGEDYLSWLNEQVELVKADPDRGLSLLKEAVQKLEQQAKEEEQKAKRKDEFSTLPAQMLETARSLLLIRKKPDSARQYTLSQFTKPEHWMQMELLLRAAGVGHVGVVPLSEDDKALITFGETMRALGHQPGFQQKLAEMLHFTAMQAKSDPTRESGGYIAGSQMRMMIGYVDFACDAALNNLEGVDFNKVFKSFFTVYAGGSLDNNRSMFNPAQVQHDFFRSIAYVAKKRGLSDDEIKKLGDAFTAAFQFTLQGRDANYCFDTEQSAADTLAKSYASGVHFKRGLQDLVSKVRDPENNNVVDVLDRFIDSCEARKESYHYYFNEILNNQADLLPTYIRKLGNISSRKAGRKGDDLTDARAIDLQGFLHGAGIFTNEWLGAEIDTPEATRARFKESPEERKQVLSTLLGLARCDFEGAYMLASGRVPAQIEKDQAAAIVESYFRDKKPFDKEAVEEALVDAGSGMNITEATLAWLEQKHQKAKVNTLFALGMEEAGYSREQIQNWDFAKQGLPIEHPVNAEMKLLREHGIKTRRLMARVRERWGDGNNDQPNETLLGLYRTVFESSVTPTSVAINGPISGLFKLTSVLVTNPGKGLRAPQMAA